MTFKALGCWTKLKNNIRVTHQIKDNSFTDLTSEDQQLEHSGNLGQLMVSSVRKKKVYIYFGDN